jgi:hypothetical protein
VSYPATGGGFVLFVWGLAGGLRCADRTIPSKDQLDERGLERELHGSFLHCVVLSVNAPEISEKPLKANVLAYDQPKLAMSFVSTNICL